MAEISWSTGQILDYLKREGLADNTLVIFTSDNGGQPRWGADNGILKGTKGQIFEGGVRVPCIAWWPGKILPGSTCNAPASVIDFFATLTKLAGIQVNDDVKRDGADISEYFFSPGLKQEPRPYFYWHVGYLQAVRYGDWKINLLGAFNDEERINIRKICFGDNPSIKQVELYNLRNDPGERTNLAALHPDIVSLLKGMAMDERAALGEWTKQGKEVRKTVYVKNPKPIKLNDHTDE